MIQIIQKFSCTLITIFRFCLDAYGQNCFHPCTQIRVELSCRHECIRRLIRTLSCCQVIHRHTKTVNIGSRITLRPSVLLRCRISACSDDSCICNAFRFIFSRNTEVDQLQCLITLKHDVCRLHVAVNDRMRFLGMQIDQYFSQCFEPRTHSLLINHFFLFNNLLKRGAGDKILNDIDTVIIFKNINNSRK